jgi:hypothetical protein
LHVVQDAARCCDHLSSINPRPDAAKMRNKTQRQTFERRLRAHALFAQLPDNKDAASTIVALFHKLAEDAGLTPSAQLTSAAKPERAPK